MNYKVPLVKRRIKANKAKVVGLIQKNKNNRIRVSDETTKELFKIPVKELKKAFIGDKVECSLSSSGWVKINKVIQRNTSQFIGTIEKFGKNYKATPLNSGRYSLVNLHGKIPRAIRPKSLVKVIITKQPSDTLPARGYIKYLLDSTSLEERANEIAISKFNLDTDWPKNVINELKKISRINLLPHTSRKDLTELPFVTIDGKNARDFDDAVLALKDEKGNFILYVAIADVAHYVKPESFIDEEAKKRGTSVYFTNKVIPMLPEQISNDICSLNPNQIKACLIFKTKMDSSGKLFETCFFEGLIKSKGRLTYEEVGRHFVDGKPLKEYEPTLGLLKDIFYILKKKKNDRKALDLEIPEFVPNLFKGTIKNFIKVKKNLAHQIIEECMSLANTSAAKALFESKIPSIYRIHPKPDLFKVNQLEAFVRSKKLNIKINPEGRIRDFNKLTQIASKRKDRDVIHMQILQSLNLAIYSEKLSEHFALAYSHYSHFTSPIRRYPDLMVHRALKLLLKQSSNQYLELEKIKKASIDKKDYPFDNEKISKIASSSSSKERVAEQATRDAKNTLMCEVALNNLNKNFFGKISGVTNFGIFISLNKLGIDGFCHITKLSRKGYYIFDENSKSLINKASNMNYFLGDSVSARIKNVDAVAHKIDLELT